VRKEARMEFRIEDADGETGNGAVWPDSIFKVNIP
jgi:hypothetical protein